MADPSPAPVSAAAEAPIEADLDPAADEGFDPSDTAMTVESESLLSNVARHMFENGRRYHAYKAGRYPIPNDDAEQGREELKHAMMLEMTDGKLTYAPIGDHPQKIMDVGTGTGIWAIEVGDAYPSAQVTAIDLSPIQPWWVPPNVKFWVDDAEEPWEFGGGFDLVHFRHMASVLRSPGLDHVVTESFRVLRPGGHVEFQEIHAAVGCDDASTPADGSDPLQRLCALTAAGFAVLGLDLDAPAKLGAKLAAAGFEDVQCTVVKVAVGTWPRDPTQKLLGYYLASNIHALTTGLAAKPLRLAGLSPDEAEALCAEVRKSLEVHGRSRFRYYKWYFWTARKPAGGG